MMIGSLLVFGFPFIHSMGIIKIPIDISPFGLVFSSLFYLWGISQFNMLKLSPLAMKKVFKSINDAVIIFDIDDTLKSYNKSANLLFEPLPNKKLIGNFASQVLAHYPSLMELIENKQEIDSLTIQSMQLGENYYRVHFSFIDGRNNKPVGKMLILHDITESIQYEKVYFSNPNNMNI